MSISSLWLFVSKLLSGNIFICWSAVEGLMHLAPACTLWLGLGVFALELETMQKEGAFQLILDKPILYGGAAAMGFMVNLLAYIVIQTSSSLTLKVLGTVKNALVVWIGVMFIGDIITGLQVTSLLIFFQIEICWWVQTSFWHTILKCFSN